MGFFWLVSLGLGEGFVCRVEFLYGFFFKLFLMKVFSLENVNSRPFHLRDHSGFDHAFM